ncbi:CDP-glycerol glycerophosphotransferase family protein [Falsibacillus pallidus]|nr:CDP-glycerol glycerophosphotransferase family protein [Falsibacillus pallidus]
MIIHLFNMLPIKNNKIFFFSYYGSQYGGNPKYISEFILENYPHDCFDIVWAFNQPHTKKSIPGIRKVKRFSIKYFYEICTSKIVITNFRTTDFFVKRKHQYYIQTWHSSLRLKHIEGDAEKELPREYIDMAKRDSRKCDLLVSGCHYSSMIYKRAFWYRGEIFEVGTPRNDLLFSNNRHKKEQVLNRLNIDEGLKILLYAPTFRKGNNLEIYKINTKKIAGDLKMKFGGEWVVLIKLHPHLLNKSSQLHFSSNVIDVTNYDDIQELLLISDVLITDYSSLMFDYALTRRPCFLYIPDIENYIKNERGLYFDVNDLPFEIALNQKELNQRIKDFDSDIYDQKVKHFLKAAGSFENGRACELLVNRISKVCFDIKRSDYSEAI